MKVETLPVVFTAVLPLTWHAVLLTVDVDKIVNVSEGLQ